MALTGKNSRWNDNAISTLPLMAYLALAVLLMVVDLRAGYGALLRQRASWVSEPLWWLASAPVRGWQTAKQGLVLRDRLQADNARLHRELEIASARLHRLAAVGEENQRLRQLLGGTRGYRLSVQMVDIIAVDLDPYRQRLVLADGRAAGVRVGQVLIDSGGVLGQVIEVGANRATALLVTDAEHAVPVQVARSGLRTIAYGTGRSDRLRLPNIPQSADIRPGDVLLTSGIGGRFPAGFPVGVVSDLQPDDTRLFIVARARPAAHLDRGREVLLVSNLPATLDAGPLAPRSGQGAAATVEATP